jgi:cell division protein FtsB
MSKNKKSSFGTIVIIGFLLYFGYVAVDQQKILYSKEAEMQKVQENIEEEKQTNEELKKQKDMLNSDEYSEKVAREKLGLVKPGERVFVDVGK